MCEDIDDIERDAQTAAYCAQKIHHLAIAAECITFGSSLADDRMREAILADLLNIVAELALESVRAISRIELIAIDRNRAA